MTIKSHILLSVDPMADKYPSLSPYNYCAGNPVMNIDYNGMEWDPSQLSSEQKVVWENSMNFACDNSTVFRKMFEHLQNSETVYHVRIGATNEDVPAVYSPTTKTLTFKDSESMSSADAYLEEIIHALQDDNMNLYDKNKEFNFEFEAKISKLLMQYESFGFANTPGTEKMVEFMDSEYSKFTVPTYDEIVSDKFQSHYKSSAEYYRMYNQSNDIGNIHYRKKTEQLPQSLIFLFGN